MARTLNGSAVKELTVTDPLDRRRGTSLAADTTSEPLRLLIVEDDADYRAWVAALTLKLGFVVEQAEDGEVALERLASRRFDVAIIDQEMPRLSGLGVIARLRASDTAKWVYSLMLTGRDDPLAKLTALEAGFDDFLSKSDPEAELVAKLVVAKRIAARQRTLDVAMRELYGLATRDELTGLFNRRFFVAELERHIEARVPLVVMLFDLDGFKQVNDTLGHLAGDAVLRGVGSVLQGGTRPDDLVARYGGDEFVMAITNADPACARAAAERLCRQVAAVQWSSERGGTFGIGMTVGMACSADVPEPTVTALLEMADRDLYRNKWLRNRTLDDAVAPDAAGRGAVTAIHPPAPDPPPGFEQRRART